VISPPPRQSPGMADLYLIARFESCGRTHRLLTEEVEAID
jgi:hypothetical protein